jgi:hypothetical protein
VDFLKRHYLEFKMVFWVDFSEQHFLYLKTFKMSFGVDFSEWHFETLKIYKNIVDFKMLKIMFWVDFLAQNFFYILKLSKCRFWWIFLNGILQPLRSKYCRSKWIS